MNKEQVMEVIVFQYSYADFIATDCGSLILGIDDNEESPSYRKPVIRRRVEGTSHPIDYLAWSSIFDRFMKNGAVYGYMPIEGVINDLNSTKPYIPAGTDWKMYTYDDKVYAIHSSRYAVVPATEIVDRVFSCDDVVKGNMQALSANYEPENFQIIMEVGDYITSQVMEETVGCGYIQNSLLYINTNDIGTMSMSVSLRSRKNDMLIGLPIKKKHIGDNTDGGFVSRAISDVLKTAQDTAEQITKLSEINITGFDKILQVFNRAARKAELNKISKKAVDYVRDILEFERPDEMTAWEVILTLHGIMETKYIKEKFSRERTLNAEIALRRLYDQPFWADYESAA